MKNVMKVSQNLVIITEVVLLSLLLVLYDHQYHVAAAASGGRMGGSSFRSRSSFTSSSSWSRTSRSSYSRSYNIPRSSSNTQICRPVRQVSVIEFDNLHCCIIIATILAIYFLLRRYADEDRVQTSVLKLQVGLLGMTRSLQKDLNQIAEATDTSSPMGFRHILQEATLSVLQRLDYCISGYSFVEVMKGVKECEKRFKKLSKEERVKFDEETLINFNNIRKQTVTCQEEVSDGVCNQYIVVTIIVAASGMHELPLIKNNELLKIALQKLASIPSNNILAAEVLWTPQKENDSLTQQEILEDYPLLRPL